MLRVGIRILVDYNMTKSIESTNKISYRMIVTFAIWVDFVWVWYYCNSFHFPVQQTCTRVDLYYPSTSGDGINGYPTFELVTRHGTQPVIIMLALVGINCYTLLLSLSLGIYNIIFCFAVVAVAVIRRPGRSVAQLSGTRGARDDRRYTMR